MNDCSEFDRAETACASAQAGAPGRFLTGTALLSTANVTKLALQCILIPVLARLLGPGVFGEMSIAMTIVLLANMLSDGGMCAALIREHEVDRELESTVYWLSALIGLALAASICVLSWPVSVLYRQSGLFFVLLALAPILVASSSLSVANARIIRAQRFDVFAAGDVVCAVLAAAAGLALAFAGFGIWSLVAQQLVFWAAKTAWITPLAGFRPALVLKLKLARPLLRFSANNLAANVVEFVGKNAPVLVVGGFLGAAPVARFAMAYQLTRVAETVISDPVNLAVFSGSAATSDRHEAAAFAMAALRILALFLLPLFCGLALTANLFAPIVLGERWIGTGSALAALAPGALLLCFYRFVSAVLLGRGLSGRAFKLTLMTSIGISLGTLAGVRFGVTWAILGFSLGAAAATPYYLSSFVRALHLPFSMIASSMRTSFSATALMGLAVLLVRSQTESWPPFAQLAVAITGGILTYAAVGLAFGAREIRSDLEILRHPHETKRADPAAWPFMPPDFDPEQWSIGLAR